MKSNHKLLFLFVILWSCKAESQTESADILITNINIIDVRSGAILDSKSLLISEGKITKILDDQGSVTADQVIDGAGRYVLPGLAEMHAHIPSPQWGRDITDETLFLYLSQGVTTIRGMLGHPTHLELREKALKNEILSPRIFTSSPSVNGNSVSTKEEARTKVAQYQEAGYDFLKLHPGLQRDVFDEIVKVANEVGIPYAGHVSTDVGIRRAIESGYASVDHIDGFLEGLVPEAANVDPAQNGFFGFSFTELADEGLMAELVQFSKEKKVWIVPTQTLFERWFSPIPATDLAAEPEMKYMPKTTVDQWVANKERLINDPDFTEAKWKKYDQLRNQLILELHQNGQGILLGSDAPQVFNVPGFSIYHELQAMVDAGLTSLEALQTGTINPARFFDMQGAFGEIKEGASADLMLLVDNPLENLEAVRNPSGVMVRGQWLSKEVIEKRMAEIAERAGKI